MSYHAFLQIGLNVILIAGFSFVGLYFVYSYFEPNLVRKRLLQNGVLIEGYIVGHRQEYWGKRGMTWKQPYYLTFSYEYQGTSYTLEKSVDKETYLAYPDGTKISVRCMPDHPTKAVPVDFLVR